MKYKVIVEYEYPVEHKTPVKAELTLHGDRVETWDIKPLEQEPILDKIRAEIEQLPTNYIEIQRPHSVVERDVVELGAVMRIIDKYKAESEE